MKQDKNEWVKHVSGIATKHNNTTHSTIEIKPVDAVKKENHLWVNWHLQNKSKKNRPYEEIKKGDMVRLIIKRISLIKHTCRTGQVKIIKLLELIKHKFMLNHPTKRKVNR